MKWSRIFPGNMGQNLVAVRQLDPKHGIRKQFDDSAFYFNCVFPRHVRISGSILRNQDRVFKMGRRRAVGRAHRPAVLEQANIRPAHVDHRLNRQRHAGFQFRTASAPAVIGNLRFFVQFAPNPVANKLAHDREMILRRLIFDLRANVAQVERLRRRR